MRERARTDPRTLVIGYNGTLPSFTMSPLRIRPRGGVPRWIYSSLLRYREDLVLEGDLAERYEVSDDGRTYTFHLRRNVHWHDGEPFDADDVIRTFELLQQPHRYFRNTLHVGGEPARAVKVDAHTVRVVLPRRCTPFPSYLTPVWGSLFLVLPEHRLRDGDEDAFERAPVGTGPFRFGGVDERGDLRLLANEAYHFGAPRVDSVLVRFFERNADRVAAYADGELDVMLFPGRAFSDDDARRGGGRIYGTPTNTIVQFAMNCRHELFRSAGVRRAIAAAVDRERLLRAIEGPGALGAWSPVGPLSDAFEPDAERHPYDPARARRLLADEGWRPGPDGLLRRNGEIFRFSVIFPPDTWNYALEEWARGIASDLRAVGIELEVRPVEYWSGMKPAWRDQSFEAFIYYDTFYVEPDLYWSWHSSMPRRPGGPDAPASLPQYGYGVPGYANEEVDRLIEAYRLERERPRQVEIARRAQRIMADEVASLWLYNHPWRNVVRDEVTGITAPTLADGTSDLVVLLRPERLAKRAGVAP